MEKTEKFDSIKKIVIDFEKGIINVDSALSKINEIATSKIDDDCLENYWRYEDIDDFVRQISIEAIEKWRDINDLKALNLISEIIENISDTGVLKRNSDALEKRYKKSAGTVIELICQSDFDTPEKILIEMKKHTVIHL